MFNYFISHTYMYARNHCFSLFRMKTVADLRMLINGYKKDVSEDGSLLAPDVTNGLVLYKFQLQKTNNIFPGSIKMFLRVIDSLKHTLNGGAQCINVHILSWC